MRNLNELNQYRDMAWELRAVGAVGDANGGCFIVWRDGVQLAVMASSGARRAWARHPGVGEDVRAER